MKILIYGLNYAPELTGVGKYTGEMASWLAGRGHEVRVVAAPPYYPQWRVDERYKPWQYRVEGDDTGRGPKVYRCPLWVPKRPRGATRVVHLCSFALSSIPVMAMQTLWKPEVVFTVEPTFFAAPVALFSAFAAGAASWLHVQDFEVDVAFEKGLLPSGGEVEALARRLEGFFISCFSRVSTISEKMAAKISKRGRSKHGVVLFPNWSDLETVKPALPGAGNGIREAYGLSGKIVMLYSGNMGIKHGLEVLGPLAERFAGDERVHFLLCGNGVFQPELRKLMQGRTNVTMLPLQPEEKLNELLNAADIHLLPQQAGKPDLVMPSKLNGILASGRPVLAVAEKETQVALVVEGCGLVVPMGDAGALYAAALRLVENADLRGALGLAAREYAVKHLGKERVLRRFEQDLLELAGVPEKTEEARLARSYRG